MEMVTKAEKEAIEARLSALIANRPAISLRIAEARALGDLKENGDYHAAREQQGMEEAEIRRLQERLANLTLIDEKMAKALGDVVFLGATVRLKDLASGDTDLFKLVGEPTGAVPEDVTEVTLNSPMGEAMLKAKLGDVISVRAPRGVKRFEIVEIVT
ncbi:MAG: transcription elongation factor GreA [Planctomycetota bacterium]|nr:transcription elongation factor GreA [Planctomycetota bacterium]